MTRRTSQRKKAVEGSMSPRAATLPTVEYSPLKRDSGLVWCDPRHAWAVVSTVERRNSGPSMCYVQWCSLVGLDVACAESCRCFERPGQAGPVSGGDEQ
jgi:hypothetical protein